MAYETETWLAIYKAVDDYTRKHDKLPLSEVLGLQDEGTYIPVITFTVNGIKYDVDIDYKGTFNPYGTMTQFELTTDGLTIWSTQDLCMENGQPVISYTLEHKGDLSKFTMFKLVN